MCAYEKYETQKSRGFSHISRERLRVYKEYETKGYEAQTKGCVPIKRYTGYTSPQKKGCMPMKGRRPKKACACKAADKHIKSGVP